MELDWLLAPPLPDAVPRQRLLYRRLREAILSGRLPAGTRLPASRSLAASLGIARNTVLFAYEQLAAEGCLDAGRQGTCVARLPVRTAVLFGDAAAFGPRQLSARAADMLGSLPAREAEALPFSLGVHDYGAFPFRAWRACLERAWREVNWRQLGYARDGGDPALREALAGHLTSVRGLPVDAGQVVVTSGAQAALDLCARLLADQGETVWVENPGYIAARAAFGLAGLRVYDVAVDAEGLAPTERDWHEHRPRLVMATPSHQYPTGRVMSLARRLDLIARAQQAGAWIVEDDYDSEFRRGGPAPPALFGLRPDAPVVYLGTFSKTLYPGLRLGYAVLPRHVAADFARAAAMATRAGQGVEQRALADFILRGHYAAHLRRMRARYAARQEALRSALVAAFGERVELSGGEAGLHLVLWLPDAVPDVEAARRAAALGLGVRALSGFSRPPLACNGLVLGYGNLEERAVAEAVGRLAVAVRAA
ncbi:PLP-dependent aminotransferase family protein [Thauera linaloolentis]|uniref:GntR family transcriptional regulator n=1 Tax=Thauera linaloolentis (strain DSM 12138 / JCM 21573 / CCUG 41526 / CIP 105981 / IAM 15112 / NBRC 102519 / 47Lol) TaxID=1123367 RepID=N6Z1H8_THAL4|nr:PLP-dependent aminotransferase family protein [Thauera linaloolentis]ENO86029.1 GntR family transcriptional regulator [Thauera linaloolentis 47Lol = DSM 12138]MCM8567383.1 PLP-dependent aminotransferase family protein [Thauera linaloolentis]